MSIKPNSLHTSIFLDSGDPDQTRQALDALGFLDGQTTNPTLVAKNPEIQAYIQAGKRFTSADLMNRYKEVVTEISSLIPDGSVSIEVYADNQTPAEEMVAQGLEMNEWINNAHIKLPANQAGLAAAEQLSQQGVRLNMTLAFTQNQAAAVYAATQGAQVGDVFYSSFVGRLYDNGTNGIGNLTHVVRMMQEYGDKHVQVLACSFRSYQQFLGALAVQSDVITAALPYLLEWKGNNLEIPSADFRPDAQDTQTPDYLNIDPVDKSWQMFDSHHPLTRQGIDKFATDWNKLIG